MTPAPEKATPRRLVQTLVDILSLEPNGREHDLADRYFEWLQQVEKAHADIRAALSPAGDAQETDPSDDGAGPFGGAKSDEEDGR